jgi:hypothetical protein
MVKKLQPPELGGIVFTQKIQPNKIKAYFQTPQ